MLRPFRAYLLSVFTLVTLIVIPCIAFAGGSITNVDEVYGKRHPASGAIIKFLATPEKQGASAFVGHLMLKANSRIPEHQDPTDEYVYFISGGGTIWIDGKKFDVRSGSLVFMPAKSKVKFETGDQDTTIIQMFVPSGSESKYSTWENVR